MCGDGTAQYAVSVRAHSGFFNQHCARTCLTGLKTVGIGADQLRTQIQR
jgi:hypothetical protein